VIRVGAAAYPQGIAGNETHIVGRESGDRGPGIVEMLQALSRTPSAWWAIFLCPSVNAGHTIGIERTCGALIAQDQAEISPLPVSDQLRLGC
jgi:hypothetical protein